MSDKNDFDMILDFAKRMEKEGKEKNEKEKWDKIKKSINSLYLGLIFSILAMPIGLLMSLYFLRLLHMLQEQLQFK